MTVVTTLPAVENALAGHLQLWISDYLGYKEVADGLTLGVTARPAQWNRVESEQIDDEVFGPAVYVVSNGDPAMETRGDGFLWGTLTLKVVVICDSAGITDYEVGQAARVYFGALLDLLTWQRDITGSDLRVGKVVGGIVVDWAENGVPGAGATITLEIDAPLAGGTVPPFASPPGGPGLPPRDTDDPWTALDMPVVTEAIT